MHGCRAEEAADRLKGSADGLHPFWSSGFGWGRGYFVPTETSPRRLWVASAHRHGRVYADCQETGIASTRGTYRRPASSANSLLYQSYASPLVASRAERGRVKPLRHSAPNHRRPLDKPGLARSEEEMSTSRHLSSSAQDISILESIFLSRLFHAGIRKALGEYGRPSSTKMYSGLRLFWHKTGGVMPLFLIALGPLVFFFSIYRDHKGFHFLAATYSPAL